MEHPPRSIWFFPHGTIAPKRAINGPTTGQTYIWAVATIFPQQPVVRGRYLNARCIAVAGRVQPVLANCFLVYPGLASIRYRIAHIPCPCLPVVRRVCHADTGWETPATTTVIHSEGFVLGLKNDLRLLHGSVFPTGSVCRENWAILGPVVAQHWLPPCHWGKTRHF